MYNAFISYSHSADDKFASSLQKALPFFKLNVSNYPTSSNAFDSLGEVYMLLGDKKNAVKYYKESFRLNKRNDNAKQMIRKLQSE